MKIEFCKIKSKKCRYCMNGKCYSPEKSYSNDFLDYRKFKTVRHTATDEKSMLKEI